MRYPLPFSRSIQAPWAIALIVSGFLTACTGNDVRGDSPTTANANHPMDHAMPPSHMGHGPMDLGPADPNYDLRFLDAMIPHHEGAILMAQAVLQNSQRPELRTLAAAIIRTQSQEITQMKTWRQTWYPQAPKTPMVWHTGMQHMIPMSASQQQAMRMDIDLGAADADFDRRFLEAMIPHHEAAVVMAKDLAQKSKRSELQQLASAIIQSQSEEIEQMKQWKQAWYRQ